MKQISFKLILIIPVFLISAQISFAVNNLSMELRKAEKLLADSDYKLAYKEYSKFAKKNNPLAQFMAGLFYQNGWGMDKNPELACTWFKKAASQNIPTAAHNYANCLCEGTGMTEPDLKEAVKWFEKASGLGHYLSLCSLADIYLEGGKNVPIDISKALDLLNQAAQRKIPAAYLRLGEFYLAGDEKFRDYLKAFENFNSASEKDSVKAPYYLGIIHEKGLGRKPSFIDARYFFEKAASSGYVPAYVKTAQLYYHSPVDPETGKLSDKDLAKTYLWLSAAHKRTKKTDDLKQISEMLNTILSIIPKTWIPSLNKKIETHLSTVPAIE